LKVSKLYLSIFYIPVLLLGFSPICSFGQERQDTLKFRLDPIQINAVRLNISEQDVPFSLSIRKRTLKEINSKQAFTLDQITSQMPGIWVNDRENYALGEKITIRGVGWRSSFGVRGIQVIMNGIPLTVADGQSVLDTIDPSFVNNIELVRGPSSSFWGNSTGGVLYVSTPQNPANTPAFKYRSSVGSYGTSKQEVQLSKSFDNHDITVFSSYLFDGGFREHSSAKLSRSGLNGSIQFDNDSRLEYTGAIAAMPKAESPSSLTKEQVTENPKQANSSFIDNDAGKEVFQGQLGLSYFRDSPVGFLVFSGYGTYRDLSNPLPFAIIELNRWAGGFRGTIDQKINKFNLKGGIETKFQFDNRLERDNNGGRPGSTQVDQLEKVTNQALFLSTDITHGPITLLGSLRYDRINFDTDSPRASATGNRTFTSFNPGFGISYQRGGTKVFSNFNTSFEAPTTTELVNNPDQQSGFNPNLEPENTKGIEVGAKGSIPKLNFTYDLALYHLWIDNLLFPFQLEDNGAIFFRNQGETIHKGIESAFSFSFARHYTLGVTYNFTDASFQKAQTLDSLSLKNNDVPGIPDHRLNISAEYSPEKWQISASYNFVNRYAVNNTNTAFNSSYGIVDAQLSYILSPKNSNFTLQPFLNVNNIFDTRYNSSVVINAFGGRFFEPGAGINWQAGISLNIK